MDQVSEGVSSLPIACPSTQLFQTVPVRHCSSGSIGAIELQGGLSNGTDKPFDIKTCRLMVAMFDSKRNHTINFTEFSQLWSFVNMWVKTFETFDRNASGRIDKVELNQLFSSIGTSHQLFLFASCVTNPRSAFRLSILGSDVLLLGRQV
jgi:hypothetical protein